MGAKGEWVRPGGRAGRWAQREARRRQWESVRANWLLFLLMVALASVTGLAFGLFYGGWWGGFVAGALIATGVALPIHLLVMTTGSAPRSMGAFAEEQVSEAIQRGLTGRARAFDRLAFKDWDVDHLVIAPAQALAIETKWRAEGWDIEASSDDRLQSAVRQVTRSLRSVRLFLASATIGLPLGVERLVVVCGHRRPDAVGVGSIDGCPVVDVRELRTWIEAWCREHGEPGLDEPTLETGCANIASFLEVRDAYDARRQPEHFFVLHGVLAPVQSAFEAVMAFFAAMFVAIGAFALGRGALWSELSVPALVLGGGSFALHRFGRKPALLGWTFAAAVVLMMVVVAVLQSL